MSKLKVLSLFAGIGGFDLGLERTGGFETVAFCEIEKHSCGVLERHWPPFAVGALHYRDRAWIVAYPHANSVRPQRLRPASTGTWCKQQFERLVQDQTRISIPAGRRSGISDGVSGRVGQLKAYGNAVVPQIPELIGRAILAAIEAQRAETTGSVHEGPQDIAQTRAA